MAHIYELFGSINPEFRRLCQMLDTTILQPILAHKSLPMMELSLIPDKSLEEHMDSALTGIRGRIAEVDSTDSDGSDAVDNDDGIEEVSIASAGSDVIDE